MDLLELARAKTSSQIEWSIALKFKQPLDVTAFLLCGGVEKPDRFVVAHIPQVSMGSPARNPLEEPEHEGVKFGSSPLNDCHMTLVLVFEFSCPSREHALKTEHITLSLDTVTSRPTSLPPVSRSLKVRNAMAYLRQSLTDISPLNHFRSTSKKIPQPATTHSMCIKNYGMRDRIFSLDYSQKDARYEVWRQIARIHERCHTLKIAVIYLRQLQMHLSCCGLRSEGNQSRRENNIIAKYSKLARCWIYPAWVESCKDA